MEDQVFIVKGIAYQEVPPGVFEIPLSGLSDLRFGQLLPYSSIHISDLPSPPPDHEFNLNINNRGDEGDHQNYNIFGGVYFGSDEHRQKKLARIRRAYLPLVERGELPEPFIIPSTKDRPSRGTSFDIDLAGYPDAVIGEQVQPFLQLFNRLSAPDRRVFICHASEDKPSARRIAAYIRQAGAEVWLDEWEIKIGDSIVERINSGLLEATHMLLLLSTKSLQKRWVKREYFAALMRQISDSSIRLLPVMLDACELPAILSDIRYADFRNHDDSAYEQVLEAIFQADSGKVVG